MATHFYWVHSGSVALCSIPGLQWHIKTASAFVIRCCFSHNLGDTIWGPSSNFLGERMEKKRVWSVHLYLCFGPCVSNWWWLDSLKVVDPFLRLWALAGLDPSATLMFKGNSFQSMLTHPDVLFRVRPMELGLRSFQSHFSPLTFQEPSYRLSYLVVLVSYCCCDKLPQI